MVVQESVTSLKASAEAGEGRPSLSSPRLSQRTELLILLLIVLVAAALRWVPLHREALGGDELFSWRMAREPLPASWRDIRLDLVHPPLYYLLVKGVTSIGGAGMIALRLLSLLCGLATVPLIAVLGRRLPGARWSGLLAAALVAVGRSDIFYSQEARSYALYALLVVLLALWVGAVSERPERQKLPELWAAGLVLMTALVYTHYVAAVYVALAVVTLLVCRNDAKTKLRAVGCGAVAALLFVPWLWGELGVYHAKHGIGDNLDWQGHPGFYDLRAVWASGIGVANLPGATTLALAVAVALSVSALVLVARRSRVATAPLVVAVAAMAWLPPGIIFLFSSPPLNLPLFGLRHVLPSTVLLPLLCCYGLERLTQLPGPGFRQWRHSLLAAGAACLLLLAALPTAEALHAGTTRYPYDRVEAVVAKAGTRGVPTYAAWQYGEGEPVNFYCARACVQALPAPGGALPPRFVLLYRPHSGKERLAYQTLVREGYVDEAHSYFTDGLRTDFGTETAQMERVAR